MALEIGERYHYWRVLQKSEDIGDPKHSYYLCECVCHRKLHVREDSISSGKSKSCGCMVSRGLLEIVGRKYNSWTVLKLGDMRQGHRYAKCVCDCGFRSEVRISSLKQGQTKSCGCFRDKSHSEKRKGIKMVIVRGKKYHAWSSNYKRVTGTE